MSLPYRVGKLYKKVSGYYSHPTVEISEFYITNRGAYGCYDPNIIPPTTEHIEESGETAYFLPISFNESSQTVVGEIVVKNIVRSFQPVRDNGYGNPYFLGFSETETVNASIVRVKVPVDEFIKNYELVL